MIDSLYVIAFCFGAFLGAIVTSEIWDAIRNTSVRAATAESNLSWSNCAEELRELKEKLRQLGVDE